MIGSEPVGPTLCRSRGDRRGRGGTDPVPGLPRLQGDLADGDGELLEGAAALRISGDEVFGHSSVLHLWLWSPVTASSPRRTKSGQWGDGEHHRAPWFGRPG